MVFTWMCITLCFFSRLPSEKLYDCILKKKEFKDLKDLFLQLVFIFIIVRDYLVL
jgi:hypothetical protein